MTAGKFTKGEMTTRKAAWRNQVATDAARFPMGFLVAYVLSERHFNGDHFIATGELKAWPKQEVLAREVGVGIRAVARALAWLTDKTRRHLQAEGKGGRSRSSTYTAIIKTTSQETEFKSRKPVSSDMVSRGNHVASGSKPCRPRRETMSPEARNYVANDRRIESLEESFDESLEESFEQNGVHQQHESSPADDRFDGSDWDEQIKAESQLWSDLMDKENERQQQLEERIRQARQQQQ